MTVPDAERVAAARRYYKLIDRQPIHTGGTTIVNTPATPNVWDANFAFADRDTDPQAFLVAVETHAVGDWHVVDTDALTAPAIEAATAMAGFDVASTLIEMLATSPIRMSGPRAPIGTLPVDGPAAWMMLEPLIRADLTEGRRTGAVDALTADGLVADMRARTTTCDYRIITAENVPVGYGMTLRCPGALALIENLFVLPDHRGRGIMSSFIATEFERHATAGFTGLFLDAHASDEPRHLYARLGFRPVALARRWVRKKTNR